MRFLSPLLLCIAAAICISHGEKIRIAIVASTDSADQAIAGARFALRNYSSNFLLMNITSNDAKPYQFGQDAASLIATSPVLVTGLIASTTSAAAASATIATNYAGKHAFVSVGAMNLDINMGDSTGLRITPSLVNVAAATAGLLQKFGFQEYTIFTSTEYSSVAGLLSERMNIHFKQEDGGLDFHVGKKRTYTFRTNYGNWTQGTPLFRREVKDMLLKMKEDTARIVVLLCSKEDAKVILPLVEKEEMLKRGWLWTAVGWLSSSEDLASYNAIIPASRLIGSLSVVPAPIGGGDYSSVFSHTHDAVVALVQASIAVKAANPHLDPSRDMEFCKLVENYALTHQFHGLTGSVSFDHDEDDTARNDPINDRGCRANPTFEVLNVVAAAADEKEHGVVVLRQVMQLPGKSGHGLSLVKKPMVTWPGGTVSMFPPSDRVPLELGGQAWYIVVALFFVGFGYLVAGEGEKRGCQSLFQESLVIITVGVIAGLLLRATNDDDIMAAALFDETVFTFVLLPIIIFESGYGMENKNLFFRNLGSILLLAVVGTLCVALLIGGLFVVSSSSGVIALSSPECFALGALLSAIDPVATISVFGSLGVPKRLSVLVTGEAVINDAVAIVLYRTMVGFMGEVEPVGEAYVVAFFLTLLNLIGSVVLGALVMMVCALSLKCMGRVPESQSSEHSKRHTTEIQVVILLIFSYLSFSLCEGLHLSGIVASLSGGLTASLYVTSNITQEAKRMSKRMFKVLASMSEALIFFNVGLNIALFLVTNRSQLNSVGALLPLLAILLCSFSRLLMLPPFVMCMNFRREENKIKISEQIVMWHAGLRGAIAWALAIKFPSQNRDAIVAATTSVILFTTYVQGGTTRCLLKCLKIPMGKDVVEGSDESGSGSGSGSVQTRGSTSIRRARQNRDRTLPRWMRSIKAFHERLKPMLTNEEDLHERLQEQQGVDSVDVAMKVIEL